MLTLMTQTAIAILSDISEKGRSQHYKQYCLFPNVLSELLNKFEYAGLIRLIEGKAVSYTHLTLPTSQSV